MATRSKNLQELFATSDVVQRMMRQCIHQVFNEMGIAPSQLHLIHTIEMMQPVSLKKLATEMRLTPGAITQLVDSLVESGYVKRTHGTEDRRVIVAELTEEGKAKLGLLKRKKRAMLEKVVAEMDDTEIDVFLKAQKKMLAYLENYCRNSKK
ncbi:MAG TPA: MarR family transcriptional regulator [Candidatus Saccharimonadales bacterium]|nr:MarR family transcriptional regulator [Candidatus Saccharimonadales bacterium]